MCASRVLGKFVTAARADERAGDGSDRGAGWGGDGPNNPLTAVGRAGSHAQAYPDSGSGADQEPEKPGKSAADGVDLTDVYCGGAHPALIIGVIPGNRIAACVNRFPRNRRPVSEVDVCLIIPESCVEFGKRNVALLTR